MQSKRPELGDRVKATVGAPGSEWVLEGTVTLLLSDQFLLEGTDPHRHERCSRLVMYNGEWSDA